MLETRVMDHEEGVDTIEMLGVAAGAKHPSIISVLMNPASTRFPTKVCPQYTASSAIHERAVGILS